MANRHLAISTVLQSLFEWDFRKYPAIVSNDILERNAKEFASGLGDLAFLKTLLDNVIKKLPEIDSIIEKAAPEWPIDKISIVDRNALRIGLYELLFADRGEVPAKVAINEAIELAKTYGGENSGKFVNGVLGSVYKELGEPGKDSPPRQAKKIILDPAKMPLQKLGGAIVYAKKENDIYLALVHDIFGHWTLSKGTIKEDEDEGKATAREIKVELGLDINIEEKLGENEYIASDPEVGKKRKRVTYFLAQSPYTEIVLEKKGGLDGAEWFKLSEILDLNFYDDILPIVTKAINILLAGKK